MSQRVSQRGFQTFFPIWFGQVISLVGSGLTSFALGVWILEEKGAATPYTINLLCFVLPGLLLSPLAGALADRWDRRWVMILSDTGAALSTLAVALLLRAGHLEIWHIYLASAVGSAFGAFQRPAYTASTSLLVPKEHYGRASGLVQLGEAISHIVSPVLAGFLVLKIQVWGVVLVDFATFLFAVVTLLFVRIPKPESSARKAVERSLLQDILYGLRYLVERPGLLGMLTLFAFVNFLLGFTSALFAPMILAFADADVLGTVISIGGSGMLIGGLLMSAWGGPKRRIHGVLGAILVVGLGVLFAGLRPSAALISAALFGAFFVLPIVNGSSQAIWQSKVAPDVQGRVFATRSTIAMIMNPLAYILSGPLADYVFEPLLVAGGPLSASVGRVIGVGQGRGMGLMFIVMGLLTMLLAVGGYLYPRIRSVESELPDAVTETSETDQD